MKTLYILRTLSLLYSFYTTLFTLTDYAAVMEITVRRTVKIKKGEQ